MIVRLSDMVPDHKMCCLCFEYIPYDELYVDFTGQKWDMCKPCAAYDTVCRALRDYGYNREQIIQTFKDLTPYFQAGRMEP